jgi:elongation factor Ts
MEITASMVKELRDATGAQMMLCKKALQENDGDLEKAKLALRKLGIENSSRREDKDANAERIFSYNHGGRVGVLVKLCCETDFVAKNEDFEKLGEAIAMHIAWAKPIAVDELPKEVYEQEAEIAKSQIPPEKEKFADKILEGKMKKVVSEKCLLHQKELQVSEGNSTVGEMIKEFSGKVGEKIEVGSFAILENGVEIPHWNVCTSFDFRRFKTPVSYTVIQGEERLVK